MKQKVKELLIKTKRRLFGQNIGNNVSVFQGNGIDFRELKEYAYGDDVRKINWNVTAREQKPYVNVFNEERELNIVICFISSGSIYFGSQRQKQEVMAEVMALLSFSAIKNSDRVTTIFFDENLDRFFKPTKSANSVYETLEYALNLDVIGRSADFNELSNYLLNAIKQRSIVLLLGDFYDLPDFSLLARKHEVYAVIVRDRFEEDPKLFGEYDLIDPVSKSHNSLDIDDSVILSFKEELERHDTELFTHFKKNRIPFVKIYTNEDPFIKLRELLK
ncbi:DUF58 domain-containing protein [Hydrogenimonas thermophila]|uniref:DUF58 domain-containing protein n=1 Tax=Hydrogenimonas thermophila TaxID=223786 RepID=A0A1I5QZ62_9BACT|nr:DUF58 domain-containing protein [Hydrogenimonas thermophila]SFP51351.1 Protein of unknown function DUF58 [Hydrogenimonas thermophila]